VAASAVALPPLIGVIAAVALAAAKPFLDRYVPSLSSKADALLTRSTVEGVLLAKVRKSLPVR
jgi:hypothetical protein